MARDGGSAGGLAKRDRRYECLEVPGPGRERVDQAVGGAGTVIPGYHDNHYMDLTCKQPLIRVLSQKRVRYIHDLSQEYLRYIHDLSQTQVTFIMKTKPKC